MEPVTIFICLLFSALIIALSPISAVGAFLSSLLLYPQALTIMVGTIDLNTGRILILVLLAKLLFRSGALRNFHWTMMDNLVLLAFICSVFSYTRNHPMSLVIVREGGAFFDTVLPYFAVRLAMHTKKDFITIIRWLVVVAIPLAIVGLYNSKTGFNPYSLLSGYYSFGLAGESGGYGETRNGFYRASGSFGNSIIFGLFFAALLPMYFGFIKQHGQSKIRILFICGIILLGALSSMSSAPLSSIMATIAIIACFRFRQYWVVFLVIFFFGMFFVEVYSNRHFYHVLGGFAFSAENAYYRIALIEEAFGGGMTGHWLFGFGYVGIGPGCFNDNFHWEHIDLVNIYICKLAKTGLFGLVPYLLVNINYYRQLYFAGKNARRAEDHYLVWCFMAALASWNIAMLTVSALSQVEILLGVFIGMANNMPHAMKSGAPVRARASRVEMRRNMYRWIMRRRHA